MLSFGEDTKLSATPTQLQVITMLPVRFGEDPAETAESCAYARVQAFASRSAFQTPARRIRIGDPVLGFPEPISGGASSAHLTGWDVTDMLTWQLQGAVMGNSVLFCETVFSL